MRRKNSWTLSMFSRIGDQVVLPQDVRFLLDVVDGEEVEGEIAAVIQQGPLIGRDVGIDSQAAVALNLLQLPLEAARRWSAPRTLGLKRHRQQSRGPKPMSHPVPLLLVPQHGRGNRPAGIGRIL